MGGAKNCPETPRQKMIAMMYLVLTAMLALNVSADILKGFTMVNESLLTTIESTEQRNQYMMKSFVELDSRNHAKVGEWLDKARDVQTKSNDFYNYIKGFKHAMITLADGKKVPTNVDEIDDYQIDAKDNLEAASNYGLTLGKGAELKNKIDEYREYVKGMFDGKKDDDYDKLFNTSKARSNTDKAQAYKWVDANFESMPLSAAVTMLTKLQSDVKTTESELIQYLRSSTDAKDFRVNDIRAVIIPDARNVVSGTPYKAQIILAARDTTLETNISVNGITADKSGHISIGTSGVGDRPLNGSLKFIDPISGEPMEYPIKDNFSVVPPSATVANIDMNVVYMSYSNRMSISAPGFTADQLVVSATNANITRQGDIYICKPTSYSNVEVLVSAKSEGRTVSMGKQTFRVRTLPNPTIFLKYKEGTNQVLFNTDIYPNVKLNRQNLVNAEVVAEYADGLLQATFTVQNFTLSVSDGRGGYSSTFSEGNQFSSAQKTSLGRLKSGQKILLEKIKVTGAKTATLSYPPLDLP